MLGDAEGFQAGGQVNQDAQDAFAEVLKRDPKNVDARFSLARAQISRGDKAGGVAALQAIVAAMPPGDPRAVTVKSVIAEAQGLPPASAQPALSGDQLTAIR